jgi:hypothetical protein
MHSKEMLVHDIIGDILDWDEAYEAYLAGQGHTGERYKQRLGAANQMAEIEARWQHLPGGFLGERKRIKLHIQVVAEAAPSMSSDELCWLAIAAASAWLPNPTPAQVSLPDAPRPADTGSHCRRSWLPPSADVLVVICTLTLAAHLSQLIAAELTTGTQSAELVPYRPSRFLSAATPD